MNSQADRVREYAKTHYIDPARRKGERTVRIVAGDVERGTGLRNRTSNVCQALGSQIFQRESGIVLEERKGPPSGLSTTVEFIFRVLGPGDSGVDVAPPKTIDARFRELRGLLETSFRKLGGGEAFLRAEREAFSRDGTATEGERAKR